MHSSLLLGVSPLYIIKPFFVQFKMIFSPFFREQLLTLCRLSSQQSYESCWVPLFSSACKLLSPYSKYCKYGITSNNTAEKELCVLPLAAEEKKINFTM